MTRSKDRQTRLERERTLNQVRNLPGVPTASLGATLQRESDRPMRGGDKELGHESLFGDSHLQRSLF